MTGRLAPRAVVSLLLCAALAWAPSRAGNSATGNIVVEILALRNTDGQVLISLYNKAEGFPRDRDAVIESKVVSPISSNKVEVVFEELAYGDYAIAVLHDENMNGDMDFSFLHLPKEGYCFSNNVKVRLSAPSFKKAKFALDAENVTQSLRVRY